MKIPNYCKRLNTPSLHILKMSENQPWEDRSHGASSRGTEEAMGKAVGDVAAKPDGVVPQWKDAGGVLPQAQIESKRVQFVEETIGLAG